MHNSSKKKTANWKKIWRYSGQVIYIHYANKDLWGLILITCFAFNWHFSFTVSPNILSYRGKDWKLNFIQVKIMWEYNLNKQNVIKK